MGYIYCITNLINNKRYVGKTTQTPEERFREHCKDSQRERCSKRPLYDAFNKYGVENFKVEELEYVEDDRLLSNREIYWIKELQTYGSNGYNATKGGDGSILYDYTEFIHLANLGYSIPQICSKYNCDEGTVRKVLKAHNVKVRRNNQRIIGQYDKAGNFIQLFWGTTDALEWLNDHGFNVHSAGQLTRVCRGESKTAHGYIWKYLPEPK